MISPDISHYNQQFTGEFLQICELLSQEISTSLTEAENKIWHRHPVWFIQENPIVGYSKEKKGLRLMFWSGASFDEPKLNVLGGKFKDASIFYNSASKMDLDNLHVWLEKSKHIQWDYKNIVKRKGILVRIDSTNKI